MKEIISNVYFLLLATIALPTTLIGQEGEQYKQVQRIVITDSISNHIDDEDYQLLSWNEHWVVADVHNANTTGTIDFMVLDSVAQIDQRFSVTIEPGILKEIGRWTLSGIAIVDFQISCCFENYILQMNCDESFIVKSQSLIEMDNEFDHLVKIDNELYLYKTRRHYGFKTKSSDLNFGYFDGESDTLIHEFKVDNPFFLNFQSPNLLMMYHDKIFYLSPGKPEFEIYDISTAQSKTFTTSKNWNYPDPKDAAKFNKLSERKPNKMFSAVHDKVLVEFSSNLRIMAFDENYFGITYASGNVEGKDSTLFKTDVWKFENEEPHFVKTVKSYTLYFRGYTDQYGDKQFAFPDRDIPNFQYLNGKRYQIAVEPKADWSDHNAERINKEQEESILNNQFELCLYIGTLDLD